MLIGSSPRHYTAKVLCVRSQATEPLLDEALRLYDTTVVHDGRLALRKARFGVYDCYLAIDGRGAKAASRAWHEIRGADRNTPFVMLTSEALPYGPDADLRRDYDAHLRFPDDIPILRSVIDTLLGHATQRGLDARAEEARATSRELNTRLEVLSRRVHLSKQSFARAQEHVMRAYGLRAFITSGGSRASFERFWPDTFDDILKQSYDTQSEDSES